MGKTSIALTTLALALLAAAPAQAAKVVHTRGGDEFTPNAFIGSTHRFAPGTIYVKPGQRVTWIDSDINRDRHTMTAVTKAHWPRTRTAIFSCPFCPLADGHFENPSDPNGSNILALKLNTGPAGYQTEGDSLLLQNRHSISALIKAPAGRTVYYFCRVHPWMSAKIVVNRTGTAPRKTTAAAALAGLAARPN